RRRQTGHGEDADDECQNPVGIGRKHPRQNEIANSEGNAPRPEHEGSSNRGGAEEIAQHHAAAEATEAPLLAPGCDPLSSSLPHRLTLSSVQNRWLWL